MSSRRSRPRRRPSFFDGAGPGFGAFGRGVVHPPFGAVGVIPSATHHFEPSRRCVSFGAPDLEHPRVAGRERRGQTLLLGAEGSLRSLLTSNDGAEKRDDEPGEQQQGRGRNQKLLVTFEVARGRKAKLGAGGQVARGPPEPVELSAIEDPCRRGLELYGQRVG